VRQARTLLPLPSGGALHLDGPESGIPLLFIHGVAGAAWSWEPQAQAFDDTYRCGRFEARGHGDATAVEDAGLAEYFADAHEALSELCRGGPAVLAGHSMGGLLAMALAAERPADVRALILVEPVYNPEGTPHASGMLASAANWLLPPLVRSVQRNDAFTQTVAKLMFRSSFEDREEMRKWWALQARQVPLEYPKMLYEGIQGTTGFPNRAFAREIDMPVLLVEGSSARSGARFPNLVEDFRARLGTRFHYDVLQGGHYLQLDCAPALNDLMRTFLSRYA
jgi:pimeloyl-ACP methyl ester carboxylesterase